MTEEQQKHFDNLVKSVNGIQSIKNVIVKSGKFELAASARDLEKQIQKELSDFFSPSAKKPLPICFLPFHNYIELFKICTQIVGTIKEYYDGERNLFKQNNIPFAELGEIGVCMNWAELSEEQRTFIANSKSFEHFSKFMAEKYKIVDEIGALKCG